LLQPLGAPDPQHLAIKLQQCWLLQRGLCIAALGGLEASAWLHLIQDGDPLPWRR